jgi:hypothetical protein
MSSSNKRKNNESSTSPSSPKKQKMSKEPPSNMPSLSANPRQKGSTTFLSLPRELRQKIIFDSASGTIATLHCPKTQHRPLSILDKYANLDQTPPCPQAHLAKWESENWVLTSWEGRHSVNVFKLSDWTETLHRVDERIIEDVVYVEKTLIMKAEKYWDKMLKARPFCTHSASVLQWY